MARFTKRSERTSGEQVASITSAQPSHRSQVNSRSRNYTISMTVRTVCFIGAIIAQGWLRWALFVGALVLPYIAVIIANAGWERKPFTAQPVINQPAALASYPRPALPASPPTETPSASGEDSTTNR